MYLFPSLIHCSVFPKKRKYKWKKIKDESNEKIRYDNIKKKEII